MSLAQSRFLWQFMCMALLPVSNIVFAEPAQNDAIGASAATDSNDISDNQKNAEKPESVPAKSETKNSGMPSNSASASDNSALPKGFDASAKRVWEEIEEKVPPIMESCGNAGLTTLGVNFYYDAKGYIFDVGFTYYVKDNVGKLSGTPGSNTDDIIAVKKCVANHLSKVKFNIDVTSDIIELFSSKDKNVLSTLWYGEYTLSYRYDEHRIAGATSYHIGSKSMSSKFWKCRKHGCHTPYENRPFVSNKEIEIIKKDIIEIMGNLPVDYKTMMSPIKETTE